MFEGTAGFEEKRENKKNTKKKVMKKASEKKKEKAANEGKKKKAAKKGKRAGGSSEAGSLAKSAGIAGRPLTKGSAQRKKWTKLLVTKPKKPPYRTYICGTTAPGGKGKLPLIVETTKYAHPLYLDIMAEIKRRLEKDNLTKEEALELRKRLYETW